MSIEQKDIIDFIGKDHDDNLVLVIFGDVIREGEKVPPGYKGVRLIVSERALNLLHKLGIAHAKVTRFEP